MKIKKHILTLSLILATVVGFAQNPYNLPYNPITLGNKADGKIVLNGSNLQFPRIGLGSVTDSVLTIVSGVIKKVPRSQFSGETNYNSIYGQTWGYIGDSFVVRETAQPTLSKMFGITFINEGVNGSAIARGKENEEGFYIPSIVDRIPSMLTNNISGIIVGGGSNDWYYQTTLGNINSTSDSTVYGALKKIADLCIAKLSKNNIKFVSLAPRNGSVFGGSGGGGSANFPAQNAINNAMKEVAKLKGVVFIDVFNASGINYENLNDYTSDGVHTDNAPGKMLYGNFVANNFNGTFNTQSLTVNTLGDQTSIGGLKTFTSQTTNLNSFSVKRSGNASVGAGGYFIYDGNGTNSALTQLGDGGNSLDFYFNNGTGWYNSFQVKRGGLVLKAETANNGSFVDGFLYRDATSGDIRSSSNFLNQIQTKQSLRIEKNGSDSYGQGGFIQFGSVSGPGNVVQQMSADGDLDTYINGINKITKVSPFGFRSFGGIANDSPFNVSLSSTGPTGSYIRIDDSGYNFLNSTVANEFRISGTRVGEFINDGLRVYGSILSSNLSGTGDRPVFAGADGTLKIGNNTNAVSSVNGRTGEVTGLAEASSLATGQNIGANTTGSADKWGGQTGNFSSPQTGQYIYWNGTNFTNKTFNVTSPITFDNNTGTWGFNGSGYMNLTTDQTATGNKTFTNNVATGGTLMVGASTGNNMFFDNSGTGYMSFSARNNGGSQGMNFNAAEFYFNGKISLPSGLIEYPSFASGNFILNNARTAGLTVLQNNGVSKFEISSTLNKSNQTFTSVASGTTNAINATSTSGVGLLSNSTSGISISAIATTGKAGRFETSSGTGVTLDVVNNGTGDILNGSNSGGVKYRVTNAGGSVAADDVEITSATKGVILRAPDGGRWRITVSNTGVLSTTSIP